MENYSYSQNTPPPPPTHAPYYHGVHARNSNGKHSQSPPLQSDNIITLAGQQINLKNSLLFIIHEEKNATGEGSRLQVLPLTDHKAQGARPFVLLHAGHIYCCKEHAQMLDEALSTEEDANHPILQIYNERDPNTATETCFHLIDESAFAALKHKLGGFSVHEEHSTVSSPANKRPPSSPFKSRPLSSQHRHASPPTEQPVEEAQKKQPEELTLAEKQILAALPGSIESMVEASTEWLETKLETLTQNQIEETRQFLRKVDTGRFDETLPLYKNAPHSLNKAEKKKEHRNPPDNPPATPAPRMTDFSV